MHIMMSKIIKASKECAPLYPITSITIYVKVNAIKSPN